MTWRGLRSWFGNLFGGRRQPRYPGDFTGTSRAVYAPRRDDRADPGEVVWAWVPFEEDHSRGKDRPVLVVGRDDAWLLALMLTSHDRTRAPAAARRTTWVGIGSGEWDPQRRPSFVRADRVLRIAPSQVRRTGAQLDRARFDQVARALRECRGWH
ncbi:type II toxin-antitoxin system PemK/MazF family toxin [Angustibacter sp. McL0619]|uniref:type II toxin-antitoxin system PemK/MazF family toxin n=1 Tax=Angustibacter sp. McL0619 TaxID=3415676 RepID=UPI003CE8DD8B